MRIAIALGLVTVAWLAQPALVAAEPAAKNDEYLDFNYGQANPGGDEWVQAIAVAAPAYRSDIKGDVTVTFAAPGMTVAKAMCWQQPTGDNADPWGHDAKLADVTLDAEGKGTFVFHADVFPNGPITVRILAHDAGKKRDLCELQLYNQGGVAWKQGLPKEDPPAAKDLKLVFADDFDQPLSISKDGADARYGAHKPGYGDFSGWPFSDPEGALNPFARVGSFLRIRATKDADGKSASGLISSLRGDGSGVAVRLPFYMECRFTAQSAPGTWPAFWALTSNAVVHDTQGDEFDIVEAYGGLGKGNPNHPGYTLCSHFWHQVDADDKPKKQAMKRIAITELGGKAYWSTTFHVYAVKVTETDTVYFYDDIEVFRHPTNEVTKAQPFFFMINYAIGGLSGWKIDLQRYGNASDMYVDYVRVYQGEGVNVAPPPKPKAALEAAPAPAKDASQDKAASAPEAKDTKAK